MPAHQVMEKAKLMQLSLQGRGLLWVRFCVIAYWAVTTWLGVQVPSFCHEIHFFHMAHSQMKSLAGRIFNTLNICINKPASQFGSMQFRFSDSIWNSFSGGRLEGKAGRCSPRMLYSGLFFLLCEVMRALMVYMVISVWEVTWRLLKGRKQVSKRRVWFGKYIFF